MRFLSGSESSPYYRKTANPPKSNVLNSFKFHPSVPRCYMGIGACNLGFTLYLHSVIRNRLTAEIRTISQGSGFST